jgi:chaperone required for assembly of F1-ATPase
MKRFYKDVSVMPEGQGFALHLDGKPVKTPRKHLLHLATAVLAEAVAAEWRAQSEEVQPHTMPLTQMANGICDLTEDEQARLVAHMAGYVDGDMLYFREEENADLYPRQEAEWEPWLRWAEQRYDVRFKRQTGILPEKQAESVHHRLREVLASLPLAHLVPLNILATGFGSLILGLAVYESIISSPVYRGGLGRGQGASIHSEPASSPLLTSPRKQGEGLLSVEEAFALSLLEQRVQTDRWGEDAEQQARNEALREELASAARFLELLTVA